MELQYTKQELKPHNLANLFPMMNEEEFTRLKKDIKENGLLEEIEVFEGQILDGRNRYKACKEIGIEPKLKEYEGENVLQYVISKNLHRRHLTSSQKAIVGLKYKKHYAKLYPQGSRTDLTVGINSYSVKEQNRDRAGEVVGVSGRYIDMAEEIADKIPHELERITQGEVNITKIYTELKRKEAEYPEWLRFLDVWNFKENTGEGISNLPPEIIKNLIYYYTKEGDLVLDPFAGSGQTKEICDDMNRTCKCSDVKPLKDFVKEWNLDKGLHPEFKDANLIFLDPPYWKMVDYGEGCWSRLSLDDFYTKIDELAKNCYNSLKEGGKVAFIIMPLIYEGNYIDLGLECTNIFKKYFKINRRLCVPLLRNWALDNRLKKSKESQKILVSSLRDLVIFEKNKAVSK